MLAEKYELDNEKALIKAARSGDPKAVNRIIQHYEPEVKRITFRYYLRRADYDDLIQEGRIAVYKAIFSYNLNSSVPFIHFARMVIKRKLIDALRAHTRLKHLFFNESLSFHNIADDKDGNGSDKNQKESFLNSFTDGTCLETDVIANEDLKLFVKSLTGKLSPLEKTVFEYYFLKSYQPREIEEILHIAPKSLDNTIQRIRKKLIKYYQRTMAG